jgi:hypothetical protein
MRRTIALVALLATSWPHAVALECVLGSAAPETADVSTHRAEGHAHGHGHAHGGMTYGPTRGSGTVSERGAPPAASDCAQVMTCGLVMIRTEGEGTGTPRTSERDAGGFPIVGTPTTTVPVADPPPPRRNA